MLLGRLIFDLMMINIFIISYQKITVNHEIKHDFLLGSLNTNELRIAYLIIIIIIIINYFIK